MKEFSNIIEIGDEISTLIKQMAGRKEKEGEEGAPLQLNQISLLMSIRDCCDKLKSNCTGALQSTQTDRSIKSSENESRDKFEEQLNFFQKPTAKEMANKIQKEQEQMEGYLGEVTEEDVFSKGSKLKSGRRHKINPIARLKMENSYNKNYQSECSHLESDEISGKEESKEKDTNKRAKFGSKSKKYSKVPKSFTFVNKLVNNKLKRMRKRFKVSENEEQHTDSLVS
ncbi:unnamed protein product [Moneuplotes crassus]|uniref:Uncharacterized protein n=1 Tax=Euplotes crassus TaxID=5936 RepID=A0AAD2D3E7_EUPCR|nr:unnamed protein product [Moneuplotes crassus]